MKQNKCDLTQYTIFIDGSKKELQITLQIVINCYRQVLLSVHVVTMTTRVANHCFLGN